MLHIKILASLILLNYHISIGQLIGSDTSVVTSTEVSKKLKINKSEYTLIYFIEPTCPISKAYMPVLADIEKITNKWRFQTYYIFPNKFSQRNECRAFINEFGLTSKWVYDSNHLITDAIKPKVTPEAFLIDQNNHIVYHGAIDNLYYGLGKRRPSASEHYLRDILANLENKTKNIPTPYHEAFGCDIE